MLRLLRTAVAPRAAAAAWAAGRAAALPASRRFLHASCVARLAIDVPSVYYDVALTDLDSTIIAEEIAPQLGVKYLGDTVLPEYSQRWPLNGITISTVKRRHMINIPVQRRSKCINVIFLVDTGAPVTYLSTEALEALGMKDVLPPEPKVLINGVPHFVQPVPDDAHFKGVCLLGLDFLEDIGYAIISDRDTRTFTLNVGKGAVPAARQ